jgi:hypothetical protein
MIVHTSRARAGGAGHCTSWVCNGVVIVPLDGDVACDRTTSEMRGSSPQD